MGRRYRGYAEGKRSKRKLIQMNFNEKLCWWWWSCPDVHDRIYASSFKHCESIIRAPRPFSYSTAALARLPYRRLSLDFITGSGCNSTSLRTDSPRLANISTYAGRWTGARLLYGFVGRDRRSFTIVNRVGFLPPRKGRRGGGEGGYIFTVRWK